MRDCPRFDICRSISGGECFVEDASVHLVSAGQAEEVEDRGMPSTATGYNVRYEEVLPVGVSMTVAGWNLGPRAMRVLCNSCRLIPPWGRADADGPSPG